MCMYSIYSYRAERVSATLFCTYMLVLNTESYVPVCCICVFVSYVVFPTGIGESLDSTVPNDEATSCSLNVRGEEKRCKLGII